MAKKEQLESSIERLAAGDFSDADLRRIISLYLKGQLVPGVTAGRDISKSIVIAGNHANVRVELGEEVFERIRERLFPKPRGIAPPFPVSVFVGREEALDDVKRLLGIGPKASKSQIVVVRGWPGVGKTTLVGVLGRDPEVSAAFPDGVLWASLTLKPNGEPPDLLSEMATWGRALGTDELLRAPTLAEASKRLGYMLQDRRMLLILDDVWEAEHAIPFLKAAGHQCATLITTRETTKVAIDLAPRQEAIYPLPVLTEEDSLRLLRIISPVMKKHPNESRELVRALECLPLALHVAGRLINTEAQIGSSAKALRKFLKDIQDGAAIIAAQAPLDRAEEGGRPTVQALLKKSTDLLDEQTRKHFAFLGPFAPKPATFDLKALKFMWEVEDPTPIVRSLVGHGLMELAGGGRYQMHAILVAHARSLLV